MNTFAVDFETHYTKEYSITTLGVDAYVNDPQFDAYLVAVCGDEGTRFVGHPSEFDWAKLTGNRCVAHNARFDETVFLKLVKVGVIPQDCKPAEWLCSADLAVYLQAPRSLAGAAHALLGVTIDKKVRDDLAKKTYAKICAEGNKQLVLDYAMKDAVNCLEIFTRFGHLWPDSERTVSRINRENSRHGVAIDVDKLNVYLEHLERTLWEAGNKIPWDWEDGKTPLSIRQLRLHCREAGIPCPASLAKTDEDCQAWEDAYGDKFPWVGAMRDWRRANIMIKKLRALRTRLQGNVFPYTIKYFGAHTGRFSGGDGFNMQNMPRGENMGVDLRSLIIPRPGKRMIVADLAQIEARVILWLAGDNDTLEEVAKGLSVYDAHAVRTMGYDRSRGKLAEVDPDMYRLAKARVLGLGFGCGPAKFKELARVMVSLEFSLAAAKRTVYDFRETNPKIVKLWDRLQRDCAWCHGGKTFEVELPSGRMLNYFNVNASTKGLVANIERGGKEVHLYGGRLAENLVQATARDVFVDKFAKLEAIPGCRILFHVHDEYVLEIDESVDVADIKKILTETPEWLEGCPIGASVDEVPCYTK